MSFVILRHGKIKSAGKNAAIGHNHRSGAEGEKVNIDTSKSLLNRSLMGAGALDRLNSKLPQKMRKDAVVAIETVVSASPEFFDGIEKDRAKLLVNPKFKKWVVDTQIWMKKEWGDNVVDAVLHMDESTPHIHFLTVPLIKDRLCAKEFLAMGVMHRHQTEYALAMSSHGLERGIPVKETKRRHVGLKESAGAGGQNSNLAEQLLATQKELARVQSYFENLQKLSFGDVKKISDLKEKVATMTIELDALKVENLRLVEQAKTRKEANPTYHPTPEELKAVDSVLVDQARQRMAQEAAKTALQAFETKWAGLRDATATEVQHMPVADVCGRSVVYALGRGNFAVHTFKEGELLPKMPQTQQQKAGIAR